MLKKMVRTAVLTALAVVLTRCLPTSAAVALFGLSPLTVRFSFGLIAVYLCALVCGAPYGAACAALADFIGYLINPMGGAYFFPMTLTAALGGGLCGLIAGRKGTLWRSFVAIPSAALLTNFLNTFLIAALYDLDPWKILPARLASAAIMSGLYLVVIPLQRLIEKNARL